MYQIFKGVLSMILITLGAMILGAIIISNSDAEKAKKFHNDIVQEIESGNMSDTVINSCISTAADKGYELSVEKIPDSTGKTVMCEVVLNYDYSIPFLNVISNHECRGISR